MVLLLGAASIVYGSLQAVSRRNVPEVLTYSAIGQAGYVLLALGVGGPTGYAAAVIYAVLNALNKDVTFLATGLRGPLAGAAFAVGAFSVCGVPPIAGFLGKVAVFRAAAEAETQALSVALVSLVFLGSALSFLYSFQVYQRRFLKQGDGAEGLPLAARLLVAAFAALLLFIGLWPESLVAVSEAAAAVLTAGRTECPVT